MAWTVSRAHITPQYEQLINEMLWLQPKASFGDAKPPKIKGFITTETTISLPFYFGKLLRLPRVRPVIPPQAPGWTAKITLLPHQPSIVQEACNCLYNTGTASLNVYCAAGKSAMSTALAAWFISTYGDGPVIVVYSLKTLEVQWFNTFKRHTNTTPVIIQTKHQAEHLSPNTRGVILTMVDALSSLPIEIRQSCKMLIVDEAHVFATEKRLEKLLSVEPDSLLLLTATPNRPDGMDIILDSLAGKQTIRRVSPKNFLLIKYNTGITPVLVQRSMQGRMRLDWSSLVKSLMEDNDRNLKILQWVRMNPYHKICILTNGVAHVRRLHRLLLEQGESTEILCGSKSNHNNCRVLVATKPKASTGYDTANACPDFDGININMLLMVISSKQTEQAFGRAFRTDTIPSLVFFVDNASVFENHWKINEKWATDPSRVDKVVIEEVNEPTSLTPPYAGEEKKEEDEKKEENESQS